METYREHRSEVFVTHCEEAYQIETYDKFSTVVESIRGSYKNPDFFKQITVTFNPWNERHWLKSTFFDEDTKLDNTFSDTTTYKVNEWLDDVDIKRYEDMYIKNPRRARIVCDGDWGVAEGLVFTNFHVREFDWFKEFKRTQEIAHGMDFGFSNDPTTVVSTIVDKENKRLYIYDEHYEKGMLTDEIKEMLMNKGLENANISADYGSGGDRLIAELKSKGINGIRRAIKGTNTIMSGVQFIQGFEVIIHPSCIHAIEEFNTYIFEQDKDGRWLNKPIDDNNHIIDALRYSLEKYHIERKSKKNNYKQKTQAIKNLGL